MPEASGGEKTVPASPHKKQRAREDGNVAKSQDLNSAVALLVALIALRFVGPQMFHELLETGRRFFGEGYAMLPDEDSIRYLAIEGVACLARCVLPFMIVMLLSGLTANVLQIGVLFTGKPLMPKLDRLNPVSGLQRFVTLRSFVELAKSLSKLLIVGSIVWFTFRSRADRLPMLMELTPWALVPAVGGLVATVWWRIALAMIVLGVLDYAFQRWQRDRDLMMTVQEARHELKELEGDPQIKARVRQIQRQIAMQRMMREVPEADVIITNPTTYAVALRYNADEMTAPTVIAKGARLLAERIRDIAVAHDVPIVRKPELARTLYRTIEVDQPVPQNLFRAVAEVLAYVYEIDRRAAKVRQRREQFNLAQQAI